MFTGIVEGIGSIQALDRKPARIDLEVEAGAALAAGVRTGDSVALDGCCLTVTGNRDGHLAFQAVPETLSLTALGDRSVGDPVNLERAMPADGRFDGHIVQGHVDGVGTVREVRREGDDVRMRIACEETVARLLVPKGSVAVDGVSLTVVDPGANDFAVALIPHTLERTTLGRRRPGDRVNLEADVLGKYVLRYLERSLPLDR
ncbi:MAG: riboflavin synthase [Proteobacteria bacterium]|nr:riboflavin synthase [Pseudomonadota bacterium]